MNDFHMMKYKGYLKGLIRLITLYKYSHGWREREIKHKDDYILGSKTMKLLNNIEQSLEILEILQTQAERTQAYSMDIYFDESYANITLTVKLFDEQDKLIKKFNVEHPLKLQEFVLLLEFLQFNLEHEINIYQYKGIVAEDLTEECDEHYEVGSSRKVKIKPVR